MKNLLFYSRDVWKNYRIAKRYALVLFCLSIVLSGVNYLVKGKILESLIILLIINVVNIWEVSIAKRVSQCQEKCDTARAYKNGKILNWIIKIIYVVFIFSIYSYK